MHEAKKYDNENDQVLWKYMKMSFILRDIFFFIPIIILLCDFL